VATASGNADVVVGSQELRDLMESAPHRFSFFQMVRMLEKLNPHRAPVGHVGVPGNEVVRFSSPPSLTFPASELGEYIASEQGPSSLEVHFLGLNNVNGPMPRAYTDRLIWQAKEKDSATRDFLDLFNHRMVTLFYRAWKRYRLFLAYENETRYQDEIMQRLYALIGLGTANLPNRMAIADESALFYAGLLSHQVRTVEGLRQIIESYFGVAVAIGQFTGSWVRLPEGQKTVLDEEESTSSCLGVGTVVGNEVWEQEGTMTVRLGPMPLERYRDFLPGSRGQAELQAWLHLYSRRSFDFVVQLVLQREEVPRTTMETGEFLGSRLGYDTWLKAKPMRRDPDETTYLV